MLGGTDRDKMRANPLLEAFCIETFDYGTDPGTANAVKLAGNFMLAAAMESMAEAYTMVESHGVDRGRFHDMLTGSLFACPAYRGYGSAIARHDYEPAGFRLRLGLKDVDLILAAAAEVRVRSGEQHTRAIHVFPVDNVDDAVRGLDVRGDDIGLAVVQFDPVDVDPGPVQCGHFLRGGDGLRLPTTRRHVVREDLGQ